MEPGPVTAKPSMAPPPIWMCESSQDWLPVSFEPMAPLWW